MTLFRMEAVDARRRRLLGDVRLTQPPSLTVWTVLFVLIGAVVLTVLAGGQFTRKESVAGYIYPVSGIISIRPEQPGRITRVFVTEGDRVRAGDPLVAFGSDLASADRVPYLESQLTQTSRQLDLLRSREAAALKTFSDEATRLEAQIVALGDRRAALGRQGEIQQEAVIIAQQDTERFVRLQEEGYASNLTVDRSRRAFLSEQSALADFAAKASEIDAQVLDVRKQIEAIPARQTDFLATLESQKSDLTQRRAELEVTRGYVIRAPIDGVVSTLQASIGVSPAPNFPLMNIAPETSALEAHLLVPSSAIGFLKPGQKARLQVAAFPFQKFGFIDGTIVSMGGMVLTPADLLVPVEIKEPSYQVRVRLNQNYVDAYGERRALQAGMSLKADIAIDRRRIWEQLFEPLIATARRTAV